MNEQRLFGRPGDESLHFDPVEVYESEIDGQYDRLERVEIEEWSVHPPAHHLPSAAYLVDWLDEWVAENGEAAEGFEASFDTPEVRAAAERLLAEAARRINWRMADKKLASHWVTWDEQGEPLLNGQPMYSKSPAAEDQ